MTVTDMQGLDVLESAGSTTAGQLADLTGINHRGDHWDAKPIGGVRARDAGSATMMSQSDCPARSKTRIKERDWSFFNSHWEGMG